MGVGRGANDLSEPELVAAGGRAGWNEWPGRRVPVSGIFHGQVMISKIKCAQ